MIEATPAAAHRQSVETPIDQIVTVLEEVFGRALLAHMAAVNVRSVSQWRDGRTPREQSQRRLGTIYQVLQLLLQANGEHTARAWFIGLNPQLDDQAPADAIRDGLLRETLGAARAFVRGG